MRTTWPVTLGTVMAVTGCSIHSAGLGGAGDAGAGVDAGPGIDAGPGVDAGPGIDAGPGVDAGPGIDAGPGVDAGPGCAGLPRCTAGVLYECAGGSASASTCPLGCSPTDSTRCARIAPSNVPSSLVDDSTADLVFASNTTIATDACSGGPYTTHTPPGGQVVCVGRGRDVIVMPGVTVTVTGPNPLVLLAARDARIQGTIDVSAVGEQPGPGGGVGATSARAASGPRAGGDGTMDWRSEGGGGGGGYCGAGGDGGDVRDEASGGTGGAAIGGAFTLSPLAGGSGGGHGGQDGAVMGRGGAGGGAIQITARGALALDGSILAGGGGGDAGAHPACDVNAGAGGGGGSGGAILLEAASVTYGPGARLITTGGGGGGGASACATAIRDDGGSDGSDGRTTADRAPGGSGERDYGADGQAGGGGTMPNGAGGSDHLWSGGNGGGGGGGAGCILVRQPSGSIPGGGAISANSPSSYRAATAMLE